MSEISIRINETETGETKYIETDGYLLLYMDEYNKIKMQGKLDIKVLAPLLTKIALEKLTK